MAKFGRMDEFVIGSSWKNYCQKLTFFFKANSIEDDTQKRNIFLTNCGDSTFSIADALLKPATLEDSTFETIKTKLDGHFNPDPNIIVERFKFNKRDQNPHEPVATYITELRRLSDNCKFTDLDDRLRDRIVCGVRDEKLKHRLFETDKLTFAKAEEMALASETAHQNVRDTKVSTTAPTPVLHTRETYSRKPNKFEGGKRRPELHCFRCGQSHSPDSCKHKESKCHFCKKIGHIEIACITKKRQQPTSRRDKPQQSRVAQISEALQNTQLIEPDEFATANLYYSSTTSVPPIVVSVEINNKQINMEIDSGAGHSIISVRTYRDIWPDQPALTPVNLQLQTWTKEKITILGSKEVVVSYNNQEAVLTVLIVSGLGPSLLGRSWFSALGITLQTPNPVSVNSVIQKFSGLFEGDLGQFRGTPVSISIEKDTQPIFLKHRTVPFAHKEKIELAIDKLEKAGVLEKVESSNWATPVVPVIKRNNEVRLCGDYAATVNKVLTKVAYPLPTANEIFAKLTGCTLFTKLDLENAYLQLCVDEKSADILTLNTTKGLYRMKRLPFGISSAPAIFQKFMDTLLSNLEGTAALLDDVIIGGRNRDEHDKRVEIVMERLWEAGLKMRKEKCIFGCNSVQFLGYMVDQQGIHPTHEKKSTILEPLHRLLDKNSPWEWLDIHQEAFQKAKQLLQSDAVLTHYDPDQPLVLACDASPYGVGAVLSNITEEGDEKPIAYGSKTLQAAERNYAQIDREALSIIFGVKKFHQYLAGRSFLILTDHKPLLGIFKPHGQMPLMLSPRMMRWKLMLQSYDYDIKYIPGKMLCNADGLSRIPLPSIPEPVPDPAEILMFEETHEYPMTAGDIATATQRDSILSKEFLRKNGVKMLFSPPYNPKSNGQAERTVQTVKQNLRRLGTSDWNIKVARMLLALRTTPCTATGISPAEALMRRRPKTLLDHLHPARFGEERKESRQKLRTFQKDDWVYFRSYNSSEKWLPGRIASVTGPVTYDVRTTDGLVQKRHVDQLISRTPDPMPDQTVISTEPILPQGKLPQLPPVPSMTPEPTEQIPPNPIPFNLDDYTPGPELQEQPDPPNPSADAPTISNRRSTRIKTPPKYLKDYVV
ncbi:hypothetical protein JTE90_017052 [Oedothorax gibbosus]|uniref:RNA-directed DNA polymerase n=1 Tax=Oedothorax gibbosus TaxID=931172 RepID=A0AAV6UL67_9ARAC|nr:hypothetical protein JTE90_017052 [Oedothorax gibbosus]